MTPDQQAALEALVAAALRAQHLELQEALEALRSDPQTDPAQRDLLAQLEAKGCGVLVVVASAIQDIAKRYGGTVIAGAARSNL